MSETAEAKAAHEALDKAVHEYLRANGQIGDGQVLTGWGLVTSATKLIDGEPAYSTGSNMQPGGIPTYTWIGMLSCELKRWKDYFTEYGDEEDER